MRGPATVVLGAAVVPVAVLGLVLSTLRGGVPTVTVAVVALLRSAAQLATRSPAGGTAILVVGVLCRGAR